ncbi:MAG TPA: YgcG family protein, partial [Thermomicrobiales bacterium]|nr:YgcG family protein [Thermomicrobiales bacterium]
CAAFAQDDSWKADSSGLAPIPKLAARVTDETGTLSAAERQSLEKKLADWEQSSGNQLVVLIVPSTKPEPIESYSIRVAEAWKIGRKGQDNGAIFLIAKNDRRMRIEVGYGLEGVLTDLTTHRIIDESVAPLFRQNRYADGINAGVDRIISVVGTGAPLPAKAASSPQRRQAPFDFGTLLIFLFVGVPIVGGLLKRIFGRVLGSTVGGGVVGIGGWLLAGSIAIGVGAGILAFLVMLLLSAGGGIGRRGGMWIPTGGFGGGGGGFGGGGFSGGGGGFSGGGGSFGGGGASGGW